MSAAGGKEGVFVKDVWFDGEIPVPDGYELADKEEEKELRNKVKPGEYFVAHSLTPSSEPRIAFYTVRWYRQKNGWSERGPGSMVAQAKLRRIKA
jgi:hypothetical protein